MSKLLGRDAILAADDVLTEDVPTPEWSPDPSKPLCVRLRGLTGAQRDSYEQSCLEQRGGQQSVNVRNARAKLIVLCAVDDKGSRLFTESDLKALGKKSAKPLDRLFDVANRLSGLSKDDVKELTEGFDDAQSDDSTSD